MNRSRMNYNLVSTQLAKDPIKYVIAEGFFYTYQHGVWRKTHEDVLRKQIKERLGRANTQHGIKETLGNLKLDCQSDPLFQFSADVLNVQNGMLHLDTKTLAPHDPALRSAIQFPVPFDPTAASPRWLQFLEEVFDGQADKITFLQEFVGYLLTPDTRQEKAVILLGSGANGKSTLLSVLADLLGEGNYSAISMGNLFNRHYRVELHGKLLNFSAELNLKFLQNPDLLKEIISGDPIMADAKFQQTITFRPFARLVFAMNTLPTIRDTSHAFFRRLVILEFPVQFNEGRRDENLKAKLVTELPGILNWGLVGLKRLRQQGTFTIPETSRYRVERYQEESNSVVMFVKEACRLAPDARTRAGQLYEAYGRWTTRAGFRAFSSTEFSQILMATYGKEIAHDRDAKGIFYAGIACNGATYYEATTA